MMNRITDNKLAVRSLIGLAQGLYIYLLIEIMQKHFITGLTAHYVYVPQVLIAAYVPLLLIQGLGTLRTNTLIKWGLLVAAIIAGTSCYAIYRQTMPGQVTVTDNLALPDFEYFISLTITLFIAQSLVLSSATDHRFRANYTTYFDLSWKLALQALSTWAFTGIFWGLLFLGAALFEVIHLKFFTNLITSTFFSCIATSLSVAIGIHATDVNVRMIQGVRTMVLVLLSWLLPLLTAIIALFLACLVFMGLAPLWKTHFAAAMLIGTVIIFVLLINSTFQDGSKIASLNRVHQMATRVACCLLLPLMLIAMYALYLRVAQYGWSVSRITAANIMLILLSYSVGYLLAAFVTKKDLSLIEGWNVGTAWLILAAALAYFTPIADPARLMVNNQIARLTSGTTAPDKFDFIALRFKGLRYGYDALTNLQSSWQGANAEYVKTSIKDALARTKAPYDAYKGESSADFKRDIQVHTPNETLPDSFTHQNWDAAYHANIPRCLTYQSARCDAWITKDKQNQTMIIISDWAKLVAFQQNSAGSWEVTGTWEIPSGCLDKTNKAIQKGDVTFSPPEPQGQDVVAGGIRVPYIGIAGCK